MKPKLTTNPRFESGPKSESGPEKNSARISGAQSNECCADQTVQTIPALPAHDEDTCCTDIGCKDTEIACCGRPSYPASSPFERPGYLVRHFVEDFHDTPVGPVPNVRTHACWQDHLGTIMARVGFRRDDYKVAPGLYAVGRPETDDPVLVTANYKLSFDALRKSLAGITAWVLVLDTHGINVWCAAGKGTFATDELVSRIAATQLSKVVSHRELIVPQLGATGVSAIKVKKASGFKVIWGPVQARDLLPFLKNGHEATKEVRQVTFTLPERVVLIPVELSQLPKPTLWVLLGIFILSGIGSSIFSFSMSWSRGLMALGAFLTGVMAGAVAAPALLPWLPGRAFAIKGAIAGAVAALLLLVAMLGSWSGLEAAALMLFTTAISSYLAMNFTGSTPFTSPTGVEKEMRIAIPLQAAAVLVAAIAWVATPFT